jgi:23S rRNA (guanosine2251-2'-O)-methyltransferase
MDDYVALDYLGNLKDPLILVLDGIEDPRNYGACLRTAEGAGVDLVVSGRNRGVDITAVVSKVASGAAETQPIARVANLARFLRSLQALNIWIVGTDERAPITLYEANLSGPIAVVMGAEGKGMRHLTREHCDVLVRLPMKGMVESLNIAVAAGVCLYECVRQRG